MNTNLLIFFDIIISIFVSIFIVIFRIRSRIVNLFRKNRKSGNILIVKFLGAGNFISISNKIRTSKFHIVSVKGNSDSLNTFLPKSKLVLLDETNIINLFLSTSFVFLKLFFSSYYKVINLEAESSFAKFIASVPLSHEVTGISNKYKSIWDYIFYDFHLVSPNNLHKDQLVEILLKGQINRPGINKINKLVSDTLNKINIKHQLINKKKFLVVSPSCSSTDKNRRLSIKLWGNLLKKFASSFERVTINFSSKQDIQYNDFANLLKKMNVSNVTLVIEPFNMFINRIKYCDLLITIDSQALHIGQKFNRPTICFYGPTSPYGVKLTSSTLVITKDLECSPCTHKYFQLPCKNSIDCMKFKTKELNKISINFKKGNFY